MRKFIEMNPVCALIYFLSAIGIAVFSSNIFLHLAALLLGICTAICCKVFKRPLHDIKFYVSVVAFFALTNPLFVTMGSTALFYISDRPYTLQAMIRGAETALTLSAGLVWFRIFSEIFTSDKLHALLSRKPFSAFATVFTLTLRWLPALKQRYSQIWAAQKSIGGMSGDTLLQRVKFSADVFFSLAAASIEQSAQTAQSMNCRGFALQGHSNFFKKAPSKLDISTAFFSLFCVGAVVLYSSFGKLYSDFYPVFTRRTAFLPLVCYILLCLLPLVFQTHESICFRKSENFSIRRSPNVTAFGRKS